MSTSFSSGALANANGKGAAAAGGSRSTAVHSSARMAAISAVTNWQPISPPLNFVETPAQDLFGSNIFSRAVMKSRLPKPVYKSLDQDDRIGRKARSHDCRYRRLGDERLGHRKGRHALRPRLLPADRPHGRKARQLPLARRRRRRARRIQRQAAHSRRARRFQLPQRRHSRDVRSPRLHDLGRHQPGLHSGKPERHDAVHSDGVRFVDRRSPRQEDAGVAFDAGTQQASAAHFEAVRPDRRRVRRLDRRSRAGILPGRSALLSSRAPTCSPAAARCLAPSRRRVRSSKTITSAPFRSACWRSCSKSSASCSSSAFR